MNPLNSVTTHSSLSLCKFVVILRSVVLQSNEIFPVCLYPAAQLPLLLQGLLDCRPTLQGQHLLHHTRSVNLVPMTSLLINEEGLRMRLRVRSFLFPTSSMHRPVCLGASNHLPSGSLGLYTEKGDGNSPITRLQTKEVHRLKATILQCHFKVISFQPRSL